MSHPEHVPGVAEAPSSESVDDTARAPASSRGSAALEDAAGKPVDTVSEPSAATREPASRKPAQGTARALSWILAAALVICVLLLLQQVQRAEGLQAQVESLRTELESTRSRLVVHEKRMVEVRESVADLFGKVSGLQSLVNGALPGDAAEGAAPRSQPLLPEAPASLAPELPETSLPGSRGRPAAQL
jgi:hypothetical protein